MEVKYTPAQRAAVKWEGNDLLLSAAAGSGKTATLSGRIIELVKTGEAELNEMLIVTFTRAAAAEMRTRIAGLLAKETQNSENSPEVQSRISRALTQISFADISTIHSFLSRSLKPYFIKAGYPNDLRIADESTVNDLKKASMKALVDEWFSKNDEKFVFLADALSNVKDSESIDSTLLSLYGEMNENGIDPSFLKRESDELNSFESMDDLYFSQFGNIARRVIETTADHYQKIIGNIRDEMVCDPKILDFYSEADFVVNRLSDLKRNVSAGKYGYAETKTAIESLTDYQFCGGASRNESKKRYVSMRNEMKKSLSSILKSCFAYDPDTEMKIVEKNATILDNLSVVIKDFSLLLEEKKKESSLIEYSDLEKISLGILLDEKGNPTPIADSVGSKYRYIFIDEFQDTNYIQDAIFRSISGNSKRFIVGDIKQSIYGFRGADPDVFAKYRDMWPTYRDEESSEAYTHGSSIFLSENFRCEKNIIDFANRVSGYVFPHGGIPYGKEDELVYSKNTELHSSPLPVEICRISTKGTPEESENSSESQKNDDAEAYYVAGRIQKMIGKYLPSGKTVKAGDIAILMRSSRSALQFKNALEKLSIPAVVEMNTPASESPAVLLIVCILNLIDNPLRDVYTAGALRSPVFGFSLEEIVELRKSEENSPLYLSLIRAAQNEKNSEMSKKCLETVEWVNKQKTVSRGMRIDRYLEYLVDEINLFAIDGIRGNGGERDAVNRIFSLASTFVRENSSVTGNPDISSFLDRLSVFIDETKGDVSDGGKSAPDAVNIMTIHKSKGLEFPVCFICGTQRKFTKKNSLNSMLFSKRLGVGMFIPDEKGLVNYNNFIWNAVRDDIYERDMQDEMRVLYVAVTRAEEQLIVTASGKNLPALPASDCAEYEISDEFSVKNSSSLLEWMQNAVTLHRGGGYVEIKDISSQEIASADGSEPVLDSVEPDVDSRKYGTIIDNMNYIYPYSYLSGVPAKITVTKLYPQILDEDEDDGMPLYDGHRSFDRNEDYHLPSLKPRPEFMIKEEIDANAAERGTATHVFLQFANFLRLRDKGAEYERERLLEEGYITRGMAEIIDMLQIEKFAKSSLMDKMIRSDMIKREFRFVSELDASKFTTSDELISKFDVNKVKLTVQGAVDCIFRDPDTGKLVIIDYKTDRFSVSDIRRTDGYVEKVLQLRHGNQLRYYRDICSEIFEEAVDSIYVYSTLLGKFIEII